VTVLRKYSQHEKLQASRAFNVLFIGPVMILGGSELKKTRPVFGGLLEFFGAGAIVYNTRKYYFGRKRRS